LQRYLYLYIKRGKVSVRW